MNDNDILPLHSVDSSSNYDGSSDSTYNPDYADATHDSGEQQKALSAFISSGNNNLTSQLFNTTTAASRRQLYQE
jgi:hypothetical protein